MARPKNSNEHMIVRADGWVTRARAVARVPAESRWKPKLMMNVQGTPSKPMPSHLDDAVVEETLAPHADIDQELRDLLAREDADVGPTSSWYKRYRIEKADINNHGYSNDCIRCARLQLGDKRTTANHSEPCRQRF